MRAYDNKFQNELYPPCHDQDQSTSLGELTFMLEPEHSCQEYISNQRLMRGHDNVKLVCRHHLGLTMIS